MRSCDVKEAIIGDCPLASSWGAISQLSSKTGIRSRLQMRTPATPEVSSKFNSESIYWDTIWWSLITSQKCELYIILWLLHRRSACDARPACLRSHPMTLEGCWPEQAFTFCMFLHCWFREKSSKTQMRWFNCSGLPLAISEYNWAMVFQLGSIWVEWIWLRTSLHTAGTLANQCHPEQWLPLVTKWAWNSWKPFCIVISRMALYLLLRLAFENGVEVLLARSLRIGKEVPTVLTSR